MNDDVTLRLLLEYLDGSSSIEDTLKMERRLVEEPLLAEALIRAAYDEVVLRQWAQSNQQVLALDRTANKSSSPVRVRPKSRPMFSKSAVSVAITVIIAFAFWWSQTDEISATTVYRTVGEVFLVGVDGRQRQTVGQVPLRPGESLATRSVRSSAELRFADGTRVVLAGVAKVGLDSESPKLIRVYEGNVTVDAVTQPSTQPMIISSHNARVEVLGTEFVVDTTGAETGVTVAKGKVRVTQASDGQTVEVDAGKTVITTDGGGAPLAPFESLSSAPEAWHVDFSTGSSGWQFGKQIVAGPVRFLSVGRVAQTGGPDLWEIRSPIDWKRGHFSITSNTHLYVRYQTQKAEWFQIFLSTRSTKQHKPLVATYRFRDVRLWRNPGQWSTAIIPLAKFGRVSDWSESPPAEGELPFELLISTTANETVVVERIWTEPRGPGEVRIE